MTTWFGTDGIRDEAGAPVFQPPFLGRFGRAILAQLADAGVAAPRIVMGRDPRESGERIAADLADVFLAGGAKVMDAGILPTPALAKAVRDTGADLGVMVTASHNPASDNGLKLFAAGGLKLSSAAEAALEEIIAAEPEREPPARLAAEPLEARSAYIDFAAGLLPPGCLEGWRIAVDCAHGATAHTTPHVLRRLGAEIISLGGAPDGRNINDGVGSEHPAKLAEQVRKQGGHLGFAHDGDGDRLVVVDETGAVVPGDAVLGLLAQYLAQAGELSGQTVVATIMSNLGLDRAVQEVGGRVLRTPVGDRNVLHEMLAGGFDFGGESSGHLIFRRLLPTGDGLLAALQILSALRASGQPLSALAGRVRLFPQLQRNLRVRQKTPFAELPELEAGLEALAADLAPSGRILVRYSGTEPKVRLLAEAADRARAEAALARLEELVAASLELA